MSRLESIPLPDTVVAEPVGPNADQCPRCQGHLRKESDKYGPYATCIQCGYEKDLPIVQSKGIESDQLVEGATITLNYVGGRKRANRFGKVVSYRYYGTTKLGTELWRPDCPFDGEVMRLGYTSEKSDWKGDVLFKCSHGHSVWVVRHGTAWR